MFKVIVISRQFGSGGRTIGRQTAQRLSIPCYDDEIIDLVAQRSGFSKEYIRDYGEHANHSSWLGGVIENSVRPHGLNNQDKVWVAQRKLILELAESPCVIVGRCADYILSDRDDILKVFIHADDEFRAKRIVELYGEKTDKPEKRLREKDKKRCAYYKYYTDKDWGMAWNYHIAIDSGRLGVEKSVDLLTHLYKHEQETP